METALVYDLVLIGSGPATLFCAAEILKYNPNIKLLVLEKARRLNDSRNVAQGWLGGSARSNVNLFIDPGFGGYITEQQYISLFIERLVEYSGLKIKTSKPKLSKKIISRINELDINVEEPTTVPISEDRMIKLGDFLYSYLKANATVLHKINISAINVSEEGFNIDTNDGVFKAKKCILGVGRGGAKWFNSIDKNFSLSTSQDKYELGVRLEFPPQAMEEVLSKTHYFRFKFNEFKTTVPTFLGSVETEEIEDVKVSNGRVINSTKGLMANIGLMKTFYSENAQKDLYRLIEIANVLCDGQLLREPLSKFISGDSILAPVPEFDSLRTGMEKLVEAFPKLLKRCLVYAPEARLNTICFSLSPSMETEIDGLYIVGDMSGYTKSFVQAACTGLIAAKDIIRRV